MKLIAQFPKNLTVASLLKQKEIPCLCALSSNEFSVKFSEFLCPVAGNVIDWNNKDIESRIPLGGGGSYFYYGHGLITLEFIENVKFKILGLKFFSSDMGWISIVEDGELAAPKNFWEDE